MLPYIWHTYGSYMIPMRLSHSYPINYPCLILQKNGQTDPSWDSPQELSLPFQVRSSWSCSARSSTWTSARGATRPRCSAPWRSPGGTPFRVQRRGSNGWEVPWKSQENLGKITEKPWVHDERWNLNARFDVIFTGRSMVIESYWWISMEYQLFSWEYRENNDVFIFIWILTIQMFMESQWEYQQKILGMGTSTDWWIEWAYIEHHGDIMEISWTWSEL